MRNHDFACKIISRKPASLEAGLEVPFTRPKGVRGGPASRRLIEVFFGVFQGVIFRSLFWRLFGIFGYLLGPFWVPFGWLFDHCFCAFLQMRKGVSRKVFFTCFLTCTDPREPRFRRSQTQFCKKQRFSEFVLILVHQSVLDEVFFGVLGELFQYFVRCVLPYNCFKSFFRVLAFVDLILDLLEGPKRGGPD